MVGLVRPKRAWKGSTGRVNAGVSMSVDLDVREQDCRDVVGLRRFSAPRRRLNIVDFPTRGRPTRHDVPAILRIADFNPVND